MVGIAFCDSVLREIQICEFTDNSELTNLQVSNFSAAFAIVRNVFL